MTSTVIRWWDCTSCISRLVYLSCRALDHLLASVNVCLTELKNCVFIFEMFEYLPSFSNTRLVYLSTSGFSLVMRADMKVSDEFSSRFVEMMASILFLSWLISSSIRERASEDI